jgi:predicted outer membrane repeat protein
MRHYGRNLSGILRFFLSMRKVIGTGAMLIALVLALMPSGARRVHAAGNTWTVNVLTDSGLTTCVANAGAGGASCELRDAMNKASSGDTIVFSLSGTITLGSTLPNVTTTLTIDGTGQSVTISGNNSVGVFDVNVPSGSGGNLALNGLTVTHGNAGFGGGVYNAGTLTIQNSIFSGNSASTCGGGVCNGGGTVTIVNSTFANNSATIDHGGGVGFPSGTVTIENSTFANNSANGGGGGVLSEGTLIIRNSTFSGNHANNEGGGVASGGTTATLIIQNSTFTGNSTGGSGGGVDSSYNATLYLGSSIIAGNTGSAGPDISNGATITTLGHNLVGDGTNSGLTNGASGDQVGSTGSPINPLLNTLSDNGGPTQTMSL